jgi:hypothetical protein
VAARDLDVNKTYGNKLASGQQVADEIDSGTWRGETNQARSLVGSSGAVTGF